MFSWVLLRLEATTRSKLEATTSTKRLEATTSTKKQKKPLKTRQKAKLLLASSPKRGVGLDLTINATMFLT